MQVLLSNMDGDDHDLTLPNDRGQVGVPEPTTAWVAAAGAMYAISRRRSREHQKPGGSTTPPTRPMGLCAGNLPSEVFVAA